MGLLHWFQDIAAAFADAIFIALIKDDRYIQILKGLLMSLRLTVIAAVLGLVLGIFLALGKLLETGKPGASKWADTIRQYIAGFASGYISVIRGTPAVVQLLVIYFIVYARILQNALSLESYQVAAIAFGLNSAAYVAEIIRGGILSVDKGQTEAGRSLGLSSRTTMVSIVIPQAVKTVLPALGNEFIVLLKETSIAGYIGLMDLTKAANQIGAVSYNYTVPLLCAAYCYFLMTTTLATGLGALERRMRRSD